MNRRRVLAFATSAVAGLAGCGGFDRGRRSGPVRNGGSDDSAADQTDLEEPTRLGIRNVRYDDRDLVVDVSDELDVTSHVEIRSEAGESIEVDIEGREARSAIINPGGDSQPIRPGELTVILYDEQGESVDKRTLEYDPELTLNVSPAIGSVYQSANNPAASALFTWGNSGRGPTYLRSFEVHGGMNALPVEGSDGEGSQQVTFVRTARVNGLDSSRFDPVGISETNTELFMPQGSPLAFGGDGIFVHIGEKPQPTERFEQVFEVTAWTAFDQEFSFEVTVEFSGGIVESSIETPQGQSAYRFENFEIEAERLGQ